MGKPVYIHYGSTGFYPEAFNPIENKPWGVKPDGGLWVSLEDDRAYSWKKWCDGEDFRDCESEPSFKFTLKDDANVYVISTLWDLYQLPGATDSLSEFSSYCIDFEQCLKNGIDAIELRCFGDWKNQDPMETRDLYFKLYGWDCDSILILNPDCIERTW
jgi:hypothetical protein